MLALRVKRPTTAYRQLGLLNFFMLMSQRKRSRKGHAGHRSMVSLWTYERTAHEQHQAVSSIISSDTPGCSYQYTTNAYSQQSRMDINLTVIYQLHLEQEVVCSSAFRVSLEHAAQSMCINSHCPQTSHLPAHLAITPNTSINK